MFDLNVDVVSFDSACDENEMKITTDEKLPEEAKALTDDSGISISSVVNADESPANVGDEDSSSSRTDKHSDSIFAFDFSILSKGVIVNDFIEIEDESNENFLSAELVTTLTRQLFPLDGGGIRSPSTKPQCLSLLDATESGGGSDLGIIQHRQ